MATRATKKVSDRVDLTALLEVNGAASVPVTFAGVDADIRTKFTGAEAIKFGHLASENKFEEMFSLVVEGEQGPPLWEAISALSPAHASVVINAIIEHTGLYEGKLVAPLPVS